MGDFLGTHGKRKETLDCRAHLAHYPSAPQKGIPVKIFQRSMQLVAGRTGQEYNHQLQEPQFFYLVNFGLENDDIEAENTYFRNVY